MSVNPPAAGKWADASGFAHPAKFADHEFGENTRQILRVPLRPEDGTLVA